MDPFYVEVSSVAEGALLLVTLASYDLFQFVKNVKADYANAQGLEFLDSNGEWVEWYDDNLCDIEAYIKHTNAPQTAEFALAMLEISEVLKKCVISDEVVGVTAALQQVDCALGEVLEGLGHRPFPKVEELSMPEAVRFLRESVRACAESPDFDATKAALREVLAGLGKMIKVLDS